VASLTIPDLITNIQEQQYKASFKKTFNSVTQAAIEIKEDYGSLNNAFSATDPSEQMRIAYCDYMHCLKEFSWNQQGNCASADRWEFDGTNDGSANIWKNRPCAILADGTTLNFNWGLTALERDIVIDVNGRKKPNTMGEDVFLVQFELDERILPAGYQGGYYALNAGNGACVKGLTAYYAGFSCATKVLTNTDY